MNKSEIIKAIATEADVSQQAAGRVLAALESVITTNLAAKEESVLGFMKVQTVEKPARVGRNPATGKEQEFPAKTAVKIVVGKVLKDAANGGAN